VNKLLVEVLDLVVDLLFSRERGSDVRERGSRERGEERLRALERGSMCIGEDIAGRTLTVVHHVEFHGLLLGGGMGWLGGVL